MTGKEAISELKKLDLPKGEYIVFGSCPLAVAGIRESGDIDIFVTDRLMLKLKEASWVYTAKDKGKSSAKHLKFDAYNNWSFGAYNPSLEHLLRTATWIDGIPFSSLEEVKKWKSIMRRPKDLADVKLINNYLAKNKKNPGGS